MLDTPMLFSFLFFIAFILELIFGVAIIYMNPKGKLNRQVFLMSICLCFWSYGFVMLNSAESMEVCLFWRRFSAIGWTMGYAILLHMILILTGRNNLLKRKHYVFMYLPAMICLYIFAISSKISIGQYNFVRGMHGWVNIPVNNIWDMFFYGYYIIYLIIVLWLLVDWKKSTQDQGQKTQAKIMLGSIIAMGILGTITDVILNNVLKNPIPQMAPIFNLIPVIAILYTSKMNSYMKEKVEGKDDLILTATTRIDLYFYFALLYLAGGIITSAVYFMKNLTTNDGSMEFTVYFSLFLYLIGLFIILFQFINNNKLKNTLVLGIILLSIPMITLSFLDYGAITVWVFPIILMVLSLVFNSQIMLLSITTISIVTQIIVFLNAPTDIIKMDQFDYFLRIGIFLIVYVVGVVINKLYVNRLKDNISKTKGQKLISDISYKFVTASEENIDEKVTSLLKNIGEHFGADRSYISLIDFENNILSQNYVWANEEVSLGAEKVENLSLENFPWWIKELKDKKLIHIGNINNLGKEAQIEKEILLSLNVKSSIVIPMESKLGLMGFIGFDTVKDFKRWTDDDIDLLNILANILSDGLIKIKSEKEIEYMAYYDQLTGLANRTLFTDRLKQAIELSKRNERFLAVVFMDLDGFKMVNDTMGHSGGDELLKKFAEKLKKILRKADTVARFGGDEFLMLVNNVEDLDSIKNVANKIMDNFKEPAIINELEFFITGSAGVAVYPVDGEDAETLIKNADIAMYRAKAGGKNRYIFCTENMKEEVKKNMILSNHLFRAIDKEELVVYYQPQMNFKTGEIIGLEALLRWRHPEFGGVPPSSFIPLAEKNGAINRIGEWVLRTACIQNKKWQEMGLLYARVGVNLSAVQFNDPLIVKKIESVLKDTGIEPKYLDLEITESVAVKENSNVIEILNRLKELGVYISIDDFGTEYSSLSRLKLLPIDRIKIDMQFIHGIEGNEKDQAITKIIINLAKSLNLEVIAEGVETKGQMEFLNQKMCEEAQGYYYYKPMPAEELEEILINKIIKL